MLNFYLLRQSPLFSVFPKYFGNCSKNSTFSTVENSILNPRVVCAHSQVRSTTGSGRKIVGGQKFRIFRLSLISARNTYFRPKALSLSGLPPAAQCVGSFDPTDAWRCCTRIASRLRRSGFWRKLFFSYIE